jgi:hypothetical protein
MAGLGKQLRGSGIARINKAAGGEVESEDDIDPHFTIKLPDDYKDLDPHFTIKISDDDKDLDPHFTIKRPKRSDIKKTLGYKKGGSAKPGLWANINKRKKLGISRPKSKTTISAKAYSNMKAGFPKKKK